MTQEREVKVEYVCASSDGRTSLWRVTCKCGKQYNPPTTTFATQQVECPKCGHLETINYNKIN